MVSRSPGFHGGHFAFQNFPHPSPLFSEDHPDRTTRPSVVGTAPRVHDGGPSLSPQPVILNRKTIPTARHTQAWPGPTTDPL